MITATHWQQGQQSYSRRVHVAPPKICKRYMTPRPVRWMNARGVVVVMMLLFAALFAGTGLKMTGFFHDHPGILAWASFIGLIFWRQILNALLSMSVYSVGWVFWRVWDGLFHSKKDSGDAS